MPRLTLIEPDKAPQPYRLPLEREHTYVGRGPDNDIIIEESSASTKHCVMKRVEGGFIIEDLDSTNGIKVEDTQYNVIDLSDGVTVKLGDNVALEFSLSEEELEALADENFESHQKLALPKTKPESTPPSAEDTQSDRAQDSEIEYQESNRSSTPLFIVLAILALAAGLGLSHYKDVIFPAQETPAETEESAE